MPRRAAPPASPAGTWSPAPSAQAFRPASSGFETPLSTPWRRRRSRRSGCGRTRGRCSRAAGRRLAWERSRKLRGYRGQVRLELDVQHDAHVEELRVPETHHRLDRQLGVWLDKPLNSDKVRPLARAVGNPDLVPALCARIVVDGEVGDHVALIARGFRPAKEEPLDPKGPLVLLR